MQNNGGQQSGLAFVKPVTIKTKACLLSFLTPTSRQRLNPSNCNTILSVFYWNKLEADI